MFNKLRDLFIQDIEDRKAIKTFYIENGYCESWAAENKVLSDRGIKENSTETRWTQYQNGTITREKAVELATKRMIKKVDAEKETTLKKIEDIENAPELSSLSVLVEFRRSRTWGYNPTAEVISRNKDYSHINKSHGYASGCGYDKESAAVAGAFNSDYSILKVLYGIKENALENGGKETGDNRSLCGYGAGYSVLPYFEGGVGVNCFWNILERAGFKCDCHYGKHENAYYLTRA